MKTKQHRRTGLALLLALVMVFALGAPAMAWVLTPDFVYYLDEDGAYPMLNNSYYVTLYLDRSMMGLLPGDRTSLIAYTEAPAGITAPIQWRSNAPDIVSVDNDGRITANRLGTATITASVASLQLSCRVHVTLDRMYYDDIDNHASISGYLSGQELYEAGYSPVIGDDEQLPLRTWQGSWNSMITYFDSPVVADALDDLASNGNGSPIVADYNAVLAMDFPAINIEDDVVTVFSSPQPNGYARYAYRFLPVESAPFEMSGAATDRAYIFETRNVTAPYRYLMLTAPQIYAADDTPIFFHIRYENDLDALLTYEDWAPIMVEADATPTQVANLLAQLAND